MIIYYNPDCSKCHEALDLLQKSNCSVEIRNYLQAPPDRKELAELLENLGCSARDLVRQTEALFLEHYEGKILSESEWIDVLVTYPVLIQRPIVIDGAKAIIGRPPALVLDLLDNK